MEVNTEKYKRIRERVRFLRAQVSLLNEDTQSLRQSRYHFEGILSERSRTHAASTPEYKKAAADVEQIKATYNQALSKRKAVQESIGPLLTLLSRLDETLAKHRIKIPDLSSGDPGWMSRRDAESIQRDRGGMS